MHPFKRLRELVLPGYGDGDATRIEVLRKADLLRFSQLIIKFVAIPLYVLFLLVDLKQGNTAPAFFLFRLGFLIVGPLFLYLYRFNFFGSKPNILVGLVVIYVGSSFLYFASITGYERSTYYEGFAHILLALLMLPFNLYEYLGIVVPLIAAYQVLIAVVSGHGMSALVSTYPIFLYGYTVHATLCFIVVSHIRRALYSKTLQHLDEIQSREAEVKKQVKDLTEAKLHLERERLRSAHLDSLSTLASQVAHDIRSPLAALEMVAIDLPAASDTDKQLVRSAASRIKDIAHRLLTMNREYFSTFSPEVRESGLTDTPSSECPVLLISSLIDSVLAEKRSEYRSRINDGLTLATSSVDYALFVEIDPTDFKSVLSNLINNSVEALEKSGTVEVNVVAKNESVLVMVGDNGKGISGDILPKLMTKGETHGKREGTGLGLFHARETIQSFGGNIRIESTLGMGTTVHVTLPRKESPPWFLREVLIKRDSTVVIIDDDEAIHRVWRQRFSQIDGGLRLSLVHLSDSNELKEYCKSSSLPSHGKKGEENFLFLCDYEFSQRTTHGVELINELGINAMSVIVTSRFEDLKVVRQCEESAIKLLPKELAGKVPIRVNHDA